MDEQAERRLLAALAASRLVEQRETGCEPSGDAPAVLTSRWGCRIAALVHRGVLDEERLIAFLTERAVGPASAAGHESDPGPATGSVGDAPPGAAPGPPRTDTNPRYRIDHLLGKGGMGEVHKAYDLELGRWVALKFMHADSAISPERFLQEARAQARVDHANICRVYDAGTIDGRPFLSMHYVDGPTLNQLAAQLSLEERLRIVRDVARAVHAAHRTGLIHRDLKPRNILVERNEDGTLTPFVVDFGLARDQSAAASGLTVTGTVTGTPAYMSPEQVAGKVHALDRRTDVYSLGVVLYELVSGSRPHHCDSDLVLFLKILKDDPQPLRKRAPATPRDVETIVMTCLEKDPARRYDSARALAEDLDRFLDGEPIAARPPALSYLLVRKAKKHRRFAALLARGAAPRARAPPALRRRP